MRFAGNLGTAPTERARQNGRELARDVLSGVGSRLTTAHSRERGTHALVPKNAESPPFPAPCRQLRLMMVPASWGARRTTLGRDFRVRRVELGPHRKKAPRAGGTRVSLGALFQC